MKKSTHSKLKNTAILFELLTRQVAADTMKGIDKSPALKIIKQHFGPSSLLAKELTLYQTLVTERFNHADKASYLVNTVVQLRNKMSNIKLRDEKYKLIAEVKKHYELKDFFKTTVNDYRTYASIYRVFEGASVSKAADVVRSRYTIIEHLTQKSVRETIKTDINETYLKQDEDIRLLAYKLMLDKFNEKYQGLSPRQRNVLREYINNISNTVTLRNFVLKEAALVKKAIESKLPAITDKVVKIKLSEMCNVLARYEDIKVIKEDHILQLLLHYELLKELKGAK